MKKSRWWFSLNFLFLLRERLHEALKLEGYEIENGRYPEGYQEAPLAYDAVWSVALAFNKTMERLSTRKKSLKNFTYTDKEIADEIYGAMNSTQFLGVSVSLCWIKGTKQLYNLENLQGVVAFSSQGDRIALTQIEQMIDGKYVKLGYFDTQSDNLTWINMAKWQGNKVRTRLDHIAIIEVDVDHVKLSISGTTRSNNSQTCFTDSFSAIICLHDNDF